jgi:hypothetical protein
MHVDEGQQDKSEVNTKFLGKAEVKGPLGSQRSTSELNVQEIVKKRT